MKKLLFLSLMVLLISCGKDGSLLRVNNSLGLACFVGVGFFVGACLGYIYAKIPYTDVSTGEKYIIPCKKFPCIIKWAAVVACLGFLGGLCYLS